MKNTFFFFLLFVLVRQQFYKIVSHIISMYQEVISNSMKLIIDFSHRYIVASLGNLNWPSTEGGENFLSLGNILLWPRAEARP